MAETEQKTNKSVTDLLVEAMEYCSDFNEADQVVVIISRPLREGDGEFVVKTNDLTRESIVYLCHMAIKAMTGG